MNALLLIILYSVVNTVGLTLVKSGVSTQHISDICSIVKSLFTPLIFFGYIFIGISALIGIKALSLTKFSVFAPIALGLNLLFITVIGIILFKESISLSTYSGSLLVLLGIYLLTR